MFTGSSAFILEISALKIQNERLRVALIEARSVIANYWRLVGSESEPEKSTIAALNNIDAALNG